MKTATILALFLFACGDDGGTTVKDAPTDTPKLTDGPMIDTPKMFMDGPPGTSPLVVKNYANWCSVKVNGATTGSVAAVITTHVTPGDIPITATGAPGFEIAPNMWHHTTMDTGTGETGTVTGSDPATAESAVLAAVVANTPKCVWVCCPFTPSGNGCSTVTEQCP